MSREKPDSVLPSGWEASTYLNSKIQTYDDLARRIKLDIGYQLDVSDAHIANAIDMAMEEYSRYAGYEDKYLIFCDDAIDTSCEVKLDELVQGCMCEDVYNKENSLSSLVITSVDVDKTILGSGTALVEANSWLSSSDTQFANINQSNDSVCIDQFNLYFDPNNPWDFDVCDADNVNIVPLEYQEQEKKSPCMEACISISDGIGLIAPADYEDKDKCQELSSWWGLSSYDLLSCFDIEDATHILIKDVPNCTVEGLNCLSGNNGRGASIKVKNKSLDTCGDIKASVQFVSDYDLPYQLSGDFNITKNTGFKMELEVPDPFGCTMYKTPVGIEFCSTVSSFEYGLSADEIIGVTEDKELGCPRRIVEVFNVSPTGKDYSYGYGGGSPLFGFDHDISNTQFGHGFESRGYDLVSYYMFHNLMETNDRLFGTTQNSYEFNKKTQKLKVFKNQRNNYMCNQSKSCYVLGVKLEASIDQMVSEPWVRRYATAMIKITQGNALGKFGGITILNGITINSNELLSQGQTEKVELEVWLRNTKNESTESTPIAFC